jgi:P pilus assembly chaperone PapD
MSKRLNPRIGRLARVLNEHDQRTALQELGRTTRRKWLVVRVQDGESEAQARTRTFALHPWVGDLSPEARERLRIIVVSRVAETASV